jgi:hypothetical protein
MDAQSLILRLVSEFGYPQAGAQLVAGKLASCSPELQAAFLEWWNTGHFSEIQVEGYTVQRLMTEHHMKPIAAFLTLDWLRREPQKALASLKKGHDKVG